MSEFINRIAEIQADLKAPKNQFNNFGKYKYRSCEDILEGLKLVLKGLIVTIEDDVVMVGDRIYIKATVTITDGDNKLTNTAFARESLNKKGMDDSQITGTASSYARKYALNGLFLIDDTKDADSMDNNIEPVRATNNPDDDNKDWYNDTMLNDHHDFIMEKKNSGETAAQIVKELRIHYKVANKYEQMIEDLK